MLYAPSTSNRFLSKRNRIERGACWTRIRCVVSSAIGRRSRSRWARTAIPHVTMSCHRRRFLRILQQGGADVHLVVDTVGLLLLEVVRDHRLRTAASSSSCGAHKFASD